MPWRTHQRSPLARDGSPLYFGNRAEAGRRLSWLVEHLRGEEPVVLGLPRGGVPVARQVALRLDAPLDVIAVRKLGVPWQPELAMGAIGEGGARVLNEEVVRFLDIPEDRIREVESRERQELRRRVEAFRRGRPSVELDGRTAVVVDDGIATGSTARAACAVALAQGAARVVVAAPVASPSAVETLSDCADEVICLGERTDFGAIGVFYQDFSQTTDEEVREILAGFQM